MIHTLLLNPAYAGRAIFGRRRCIPWQAPLHPPRGHDGPPKRPWRQIPADAGSVYHRTGAGDRR